MSLETASLMTFIVFIESFLLIRLYKNLAGKLNLMDKPNARSSHSVPTPRGAGVVFLFCILPVIGFIFYIEGIGLKPFSLLLAGSAFYTLLGFLDDVKTLSAYQRLLPQLAIAVWLLLSLTNYLEIPFEVKFIPIESQALSFVFGVLFVCWMVNLFNFMDGLDGFLGGQSFLVGLAGYALCVYQGQESLAVLYLSISAIVLPFLYFNWRPAKVFMGDSGAYFLGFFFALMGLLGKIEYNLSLVAQIIVMGTLICDATMTLFFRLIITKKIFKAHMTHGFHLLRHKHGWRTSRVAFLYMSITAFWFFPWSMAAVNKPDYSVLFCFLSYTPFLMFLLFLGAGRDWKSDPS